MIVSGFTQRTVPPSDEDLFGFTGCHIHCFRCRQAMCKHPVDNVTACAMTACKGCGLRFHECKSEEHALTCQEERVPCLNAHYGCPHFVKRSGITSHLPVCPASVVSCGEEWSRWPMYTAEKGVRHPLPPTKTYIDCGQLDISLAMRDQRMLIDSLKAPPKLRRTLRNPLTQKYPAAPFTNRSPSVESDLVTSTDTLQTVSDDESDAPWDLSRRQPGLKDSIVSRLVHVPKDTTESLTQELKLNEVAENKGKETSDEKDDCSVRSSVSADKDHDRSRSRSVSVLHDVGGSQLHKILGVKLGDENEAEIRLHKILGVSITHDCINKYVGKPSSMYTFICAQNFRRDQYKWHFKNVHDEIIPGLGGYFEHRCPLAYQGCTFSYQRMVPIQPDSELYFSWLQESFGVKSLLQPCDLPLSSSNNDEQVTQASRDSSPQNNVCDNTNSNSCGPSISDLANFDRDFDQMKVSIPANEDSAIGLQENVSPISSDQCHTEKKEMVTIQPVVYTAVNPDSKLLLTYNVEAECDADQLSNCCGLTDLPFFIIQEIAGYLDSFSLCNLSLTCRLLRDICCSMLDDHGIVLLNWQRQTIGDKISWKVANKRWIFSTSFEPIKSWKMNDNHISMSDHLKVCPFNQDKLTHTSFNNKIILD